MTQLIRTLRVQDGAGALDHTLALALAVAVLANAVCLWSYL